MVRHISKIIFPWYFHSVIPTMLLYDSQDDKFLELAVNGRATTIVAGDQGLLILNPYQSIQIVTPKKYLKGDLNSGDACNLAT